MMLGLPQTAAFIQGSCGAGALGGGVMLQIIPIAGGRECARTLPMVMVMMVIYGDDGRMMATVMMIMTGPWSTGPGWSKVQVPGVSMVHGSWMVHGSTGARVL